MKYLILILAICCGMIARAQTHSYQDSMQQYFAAYVAKHEVVTGDDKKRMRFYAPDESWSITADFEPVKNAPWFPMNTSSDKTKMYRQFGKISFIIKNERQTLYIYQAQALLQNPEYWDHLFLPFMDATNGAETYETGRYLDLRLQDIDNNKVMIDFNKAYNPYCAYGLGKYNCPIPPKENRLKIAINAGEKKFEQAD